MKPKNRLYLLYVVVGCWAFLKASYFGNSSLKSFWRDVKS